VPEKGLCSKARIAQGEQNKMADEKKDECTHTREPDCWDFFEDGNGKIVSRRCVICGYEEPCGSPCDDLGCEWEQHADEPQVWMCRTCGEVDRRTSEEHPIFSIAYKTERRRKKLQS
jgi:hypothetical protein